MIFLTETLDGTLVGPEIDAVSWEDAEEQAMRLSLRVVGILVEEVPASDRLVAYVREGLRIPELEFAD